MFAAASSPSSTRLMYPRKVDKVRREWHGTGHVPVPCRCSGRVGRRPVGVQRLVKKVNRQVERPAHRHHADDDDRLASRIDRRRLLKTCGIGLGCLATSGVLSAPVRSAFAAAISRPQAVPPSVDVQIFQTAASLRERGSGDVHRCTRAGLSSGRTRRSPSSSRRPSNSTLNTGQHSTPKSRALGGTRQDAPNPAYAHLVEPVASASTDIGAVVWQQAATLEEVATDTYLANLTLLADPTMRALMASVMGVEAQHLAMLRAVGTLFGTALPDLVAIPTDVHRLPPTIGTVAVPGAFESPNLASPPAEGAVRMSGDGGIILPHRRRRSHRCRSRRRLIPTPTVTTPAVTTPAVTTPTVTTPTVHDADRHRRRPRRRARAPALAGCPFCDNASDRRALLRQRRRTRRRRRPANRRRRRPARRNVPSRPRRHRPRSTRPRPDPHNRTRPSLPITPHRQSACEPPAPNEHCGARHLAAAPDRDPKPTSPSARRWPAWKSWRYMPIRQSRGGQRRQPQWRPAGNRRLRRQRPGPPPSGPRRVEQPARDRWPASGHGAAVEPHRDGQRRLWRRDRYRRCRRRAVEPRDDRGGHLPSRHRHAPVVVDHLPGRIDSSRSTASTWQSCCFSWAGIRHQTPSRRSSSPTSPTAVRKALSPILVPWSIPGRQRPHSDQTSSTDLQSVRNIW